MDFKLPDYNVWLMLPEIVLFLAALAVMTFDVVTRRKSGEAVGYLAMAGVALSAICLTVTDYGPGFGNMFFNDPMALFFKVVVLGAAFMAIGSSFGITREKIVNHRGEFFGLLMLSTVGMMFLSSSRELISLYIGLELTTVPLFVLAAFFKDDRHSVESGAKYLIMGAFSSALLLYGLSFVYGLTGTTDLLGIRMTLAYTQLAHGGDIGIILILATIAIIAGVGFKLGLPPFHQWVPDVYQGAPTPVTAFLSVGSKAAGVVAFAKILLLGLLVFFEPVMRPNDWGLLVGLMAAAAMIIGNAVAIRQTNIKRMLAYSSIAHAGYIMVGLLAVNELGLAAVGFYMFAYLFTNMGAFAIVTLVEDKTGSCEIKDYAGLSVTSPFLALSMTVFLLSLTGIPPLAGFVGKWYVFLAAIRQAGTASDMTWIYALVGVAVLTSVFALYYYANVIMAMYFDKVESPHRVTFSPVALVIVGLGLAGVVVFGLYPSPIVDFASKMPEAFGLLMP